MGNKIAGRNFPKSSPQSGDNRRDRSRYNTPGYYQYNEELANMGVDRTSDFEENPDYLKSTSKYENYAGGGYYGSDHSRINDIRRGRDYEQNAGYRDSYEHLPTGQWPEVEEAARRRGFDLKQYELEQRGVHRGKGPRSYQRSDARIREDVNDLLLEDRYVDATDIDVTVENGEVILTGTVDDRNTKRRAEDILEDVPGVKHLENRLRVRHPSGETVNIQNSKQGQEHNR